MIYGYDYDSWPMELAIAGMGNFHAGNPNMKASRSSAILGLRNPSCFPVRLYQLYCHSPRGL